MEKHYVGFEIGQLRGVMLHCPNLSLECLTPSNYQELLSGDVLSVERAGGGHDIFANTLRQQGIRVLSLTDLLTQTLDIPETKSWLLGAQISDYRLDLTFATDVHTWLAEMSHQDLAHHLSGRLTYSEIPVSVKDMVVDTHDINDFIIKPLPDHLFTYGTSCWTYNGVSINPMAESARRRETSNLRAIYCWHPQFAGDEFIKYLSDENINYDHATLEGGDMLVIGRRAVLISMSERTTPQGIEFLAQALFRHRQAGRVIVVELSKHRPCMCLDTVITHIDIDTSSVYPEVVCPDINCWTLTPDGHGNLKRTQESTFLHAIEKALDTDQVRLVITGGDVFETEYGQWNDANNVLTLRSGVVVGHERNIWTNKKYDKAGITVLPIPGDELGRGHGDARCMSCPLHRDDI